MMLSNTTKYAIRALIYLAIYSSGEKKAGIREISSQLGIPSPFLGKILQVLARRKILNSTKGPHGGFCLQKSAAEISIMEIVEIIDGADAFDACVIRTTKCRHDAPCSLHDKYAPLRAVMKNLYNTESIQDLANQYRQEKERIRI